jgi:hypothetical protein
LRELRGNFHFRPIAGRIRQFYLIVPEIFSQAGDKSNVGGDGVMA